ncbi:GIY-YIG endonuclease [Rhizophagus clarus]|nr:GIY-YIG endonuclease [Rhizophagus clarus]
MLDIRLRRERHKALKGLAGVYVFFCHDSGKYYVGSSSNIANRIDYYIPSNANSKAKSNSLILRALLKYGLSSFVLLVLPLQNPKRETLLELEQELIDTLSPEYNLLPQAGSFKGYTHTDEACSNMSKAKQGKNNPMYGRKGIESPRYGTGQNLYIYSSDKLELISVYKSLREAQVAMQSDMRTLKAFANSQKVFRSMSILSLKPLETK